MNWTPAQSNAINIPVSDIIVSAAAGSGKTAVMAERIIKRLTEENHVDIDRILVVTYTNAAASEIKERVMKKILEKLEQSNDDTLQKQLIMLNNAHFCTIHSFCLELLKKYFYKLGIDPSVKTGDEADMELLLKEAVSSVINEYYGLNDNDFQELISFYSKGKEASLENIVLTLYKFSRTMPNSEAWLNSLASSYSGRMQEAESFIVDCAISALHYIKCEYERALELISQTGSCEKWQSTIAYEKLMIEKALLENRDYDSFHRALWSVEFNDLPTTKGENAKNKSLIGACRDKAKKAVNSLKEKLFCITPEYIEQDNANVYPIIKKLVEVVKKTGESFDSLKRQRNTIDFSDYEHMTLALLQNPDGTPSDIAYSVSNQFDEIYVDEFQDCNNIQNAIFNLISGGIRNKPNIFCVGDMKQSIYKFRDANPLNFRQKCDVFPLYDGENAKESNKILLNSNFRSRASVLDFVNTVFSQLMSTSCGELIYNSDEELNYGADFEDVNPDANVIDIDIINESNDFGDSVPDENNKYSKTEAEVIHIASKIRNYINDGYMLYDRKTKKSRKAQYRDFVILLRSPKAYTSAFEEIFSNYGIPLYCDNSGGYFETEEIDYLINLLKIIDNPDDDIALATVMKNPVFGFDENDLLTIRLGGGKGSFYKCIHSYIKNNTDKIKTKLEAFISLLKKYHQKSRYMETDEFLGYILEDISYFLYLSAFPDSKMRKANVRFLIQKAKQFEESNFKGIFSFIRYVENIKDSKSAECAKTIGADDNVVRLMSIHKSKGLEFPIVILAGTGRQYNMQDLKRSFVIHKDFGIGFDSVYADKAFKVPTVNKISIKQKIKYETVSEELRVLYVALTRPVEKLIITGTVKRGSGFLNSLERLLSIQDYNISPYIVSATKHFLEAILMGCMRSEGCELSSFQNEGIRVKDNVRYNISTINMCDISLGNSDSKLREWQSEYDMVTKAFEEFSSSLSYTYPHSKSSLIPGNVTVTEIKKMNSEDDAPDFYDDITLKKPANFAISKRIYGSTLGTLVHLCMERLDLSDISDESRVLYQLDKLFSDGIISEDEIKAVDISKITRFGNSALGKRIAQNLGTLKKEFSFKYMINASDIYNISSDDEVIVQGTVDAFFENPDGSLVLIDYKTDKVLNGDTSAIAQRYRVQLECYAKALEAMLGKKVGEKLIYLFDTGEVINL